MAPGSGTLEALQPGCEPSLLAHWDLPRFQNPVCMFRLVQTHKLMMLEVFGLQLWMGQAQACGVAFTRILHSKMTN